MRRGEIWWVEFDERRPVVLLSEDEPSGFRVMQVVAPADTDFSGLGIEVAVGVPEGLPFDGVLRFAFPRPGFTPCTWLTTLSREDLTERAGAVPAAKLSEIDDALRASEPGRSGLRPRRPGSARSRTPSASGPGQTQKERTLPLATAGLARTISGPRPLNNKITTHGWSTKGDHLPGCSRAPAARRAAAAREPHWPRCVTRPSPGPAGLPAHTA